MNYSTLYSIYYYTMEHLPDMIFIFPFDNNTIDNFIYVNKVACDTLNLNKNDLLNMRIIDIFPSITPDNITTYGDSLIKHGKIILRDIIDNKLYKSTIIYDPHNKVAICISKNDTYRHKLKTQLEFRNDELITLRDNVSSLQCKLDNVILHHTEFFENMPIGGIFLDNNGLVLDINKIACIYFELKKEDLINKLFISNLQSSDKSEFIRFIKCIKDNVPAHHRFEIITLNDNIKTLEMYGCLYGNDIYICIVDVSNQNIIKSFPSMVSQDHINSTIISPCNILIVEDETTNVLVMNSIFTKMGCTSDIARDGKEAIDKLKDKTYDIIFMDISMPILNGVDATKIIRNQLDIDTPIIAVTGFDSQKDIDRFFDAGMNDYIQKPFQTENIINIIKKFVNRS